MNRVQAMIEQFVGYTIAWDDTASWAQAVGTVAAIVFAWWQGRRAAYLAEKAKRGETLRFLGHMLGMTESALQSAERYLEALVRRDKPRCSEIAVEIRDHRRAFRKLNEVPVEQWPSPSLASAFDLACEALDELGADDLQVIKEVGKPTPPSALQQDVGRRVQVFQMRSHRLFGHIGFYKAINEEGPGPIIRFRRMASKHAS